jgi:uncharacterized protein YbjT (DUF2867 family)
MKLLVLGGTKFLGRATVEDALARGHEVTLFNRGETNPELFPESQRCSETATQASAPVSSWGHTTRPAPLHLLASPRRARR